MFHFPALIRNNFPLVCNELQDGRLAIIGIGTSSVLTLIKSISNSLRIPYLAVEWSDSNTQPISSFDAPHEDKQLPAKFTNQLNLHPPASEVTRAVIDLVIHYRWEYVTILYTESYGPDRVRDLIKLPYSTVWTNKKKKLRLQIRQLSVDKANWVYQLKEIKLSGSSHIIIDIERKNFNDFIRIVSVARSFERETFYSNPFVSSNV